MISKVLKTTQLFLILLVVGLSVSQAQTVEVTATQNEKRALVKELLDLTNARQGSEEIFNAQFDQMEKQLPEISWQAISSMEDLKKLTPAQREEVRAKVKESSLRLGQRIRVLFLQRIDMKQLVEDITYSVYEKHFTESELKDLVTFYRSETGKKVIAVTPTLYAESIAKAAETIAPKVQEIMEEVQKDETKELARQVEQLLQSMQKPAPPPPRRTTPKKSPVIQNPER